MKSNQLAAAAIYKAQIVIRQSVDQQTKSTLRRLMIGVCPPRAAVKRPGHPITYLATTRTASWRSSLYPRPNYTYISFFHIFIRDIAKIDGLFPTSPYNRYFNIISLFFLLCILQV